MRVLVLVATLMLSACSSTFVERQGAPTGSHWPQSADQCRAQPELDWCAHAH